MSDATALAATIAEGRVSATDAMSASLARAREVPGAVVRLLPEAGARAAAEAAPRGVFGGVPFLGKDLGSAARGLGISACNAVLARRVVDPEEDSALFARFRAGGLVPFGLTTVPEFGLALTAEPRDHPPAANPFDARLSAGGSSGGAALAVAAGVVAIAHATDAAGSIRVPAACCGLWGLKPSRGSTPMGPGFFNHLMGLASELVLARSRRDVEAAFGLVSGRSQGPEGDAVPRPLGRRVVLVMPEGVAPAQAAAVRAAGDRLAQRGFDLSEREPPRDLSDEAVRIVATVLSVSLAAWVDGSGLTDADLTGTCAAIAARGRATTATDLFVAARAMAQVSHAMCRLFEDADALLMPVLADGPPPLGAFPTEGMTPDGLFREMARIAPLAPLANVAGLPALAFPAAMSDGVPVGAQLLGPIGSDRALLDMAGALEGLCAVPYPAPIAGMPQ